MRKYRFWGGLSWGPPQDGQKSARSDRLGICEEFSRSNFAEIEGFIMFWIGLDGPLTCEFTSNSKVSLCFEEGWMGRPPVNSYCVSVKKIVRLRKLINCPGQFWSKIGPVQFFDLSFSQNWAYAFQSLRSASHSNKCNKKSTAKNRLKFSKKNGLSKQELRCNNCPAPEIN